MVLLYDLAIFIYHVSIRVVSPFNAKARSYLSGRKGWHSRLKEKRKPEDKYIWVHCASLGEFEQGRPVIEAIKKGHPDYKIVLTFFSPSGYEIRKNYAQADIISYLPADRRRNASLFLEVIQPDLAFFVKYEFWYHYLTQLKQRGVPTYLISGIFRKEQPFFSRMPWGSWFRKILSCFTRLYLQDQRSADLLRKVGIENCTIAGDTRFDRVYAIAKSSQTLPIVDKFKEGHPLLVAGSTWKPDEELIVPILDDLPDLQLIIVPHEVSAENVNRLKQLLKRTSVLYSEATGENVKGVRVMIVDSVGLLSSIYKYADVAYVGGGFGVGIHNILEPATFGMPVFFGPNFKKFREARQLVEKGSAFPVSAPEEFSKELKMLLESSLRLKETSEISSHYVNENIGATQRILNEIFT